jgi:hypothetical protein
MTPEQLRTVLEEVTRATLPSWYAYAVFIFLAALAAALGAWGGAYLTELGKRAAIEEARDSIIEEVRRTTKATEGIKTELAGGLWLEQARWNRRWDVYVELMRTLSIASMDCVDQLESLRAEARKSGGVLAEDSPALERAKKAIGVSLRGLQQAGDVAAIILPEKVFAALTLAVGRLDSAQTPGDVEHKFLELQAVLDRAQTEIAWIARKDLHMALAQYSEG